jgi:hypothetical protein
VQVSPDCLGMSTDRRMEVSGSSVDHVCAAVERIIRVLISHPLTPGTKATPFVPGSQDGTGGGAMPSHLSGMHPSRSVGPLLSAGGYGGPPPPQQQHAPPPHHAAFAGYAPPGTQGGMTMFPPA